MFVRAERRPKRKTTSEMVMMMEMQMRTMMIQVWSGQGVSYQSARRLVGWMNSVLFIVCLKGGKYARRVNKRGSSYETSCYQQLNLIGSLLNRGRRGNAH